MRAVVTGLIASMPVGGVAWDYGQYALGLERLGIETFYLEDSGWAYDPSTGLWADDHAAGANYVADFFAGTSLAQRWCVRDDAGRSWGMGLDALADVVASADVLVNVSNCAQLRDEYLRCPHKVLIDTDPGFNHFRTFLARPAAGHDWRAHDAFLTYATCTADRDCRLPDLGVDWRPTVPPVLLEAWTAAPPRETWTTVMSWNNYDVVDPVEAGGERFGGKEREFSQIEDLPAALPDLALEVAAGGAHPPLDRWRARGWSVRDAQEVSVTPDAYRSYVTRSRGELSVAKHVYVATRSGWFSCRSACYLAAGLPVVVQDTGFSRRLPTGEGLLAFRDGDSAASCLASVESDYEGHSQAAREVAEEHFAAERVLGEVLELAGVS